MGLFDAFTAGKKDINEGIREYKKTEGARLIDVRSQEEYNQGHIPGSANVPVDNCQKIESVISKKDTPLFVYCLSGGRAGKAVSAFKKLGYTNVTNIGGIEKYRGQKAVR